MKIFAFHYGEDIETALFDALISLQGIHGEKGLKGYSELQIHYAPESKNWPNPEKLELMSPQIILGAVAQGEEKAFYDFFKPYLSRSGLGSVRKVYFGSEIKPGIIKNMGFDQAVDARSLPSQVINFLTSKKEKEVSKPKESLLKKLKKYWS